MYWKKTLFESLQIGDAEFFWSEITSFILTKKNERVDISNLPKYKIENLYFQTLMRIRFSF